MEPLEPMKTIAETASILRIDPQTVRRMCKEGRLPAVKVGRHWRIPAQKLAAIARGEAEIGPRSGSNEDD